MPKDTIDIRKKVLVVAIDLDGSLLHKQVVDACPLLEDRFACSIPKDQLALDAQIATEGIIIKNNPLFLKFVRGIKQHYDIVRVVLNSSRQDRNTCDENKLKETTIVVDGVSKKSYRYTGSAFAIGAQIAQALNATFDPTIEADDWFHNGQQGKSYEAYKAGSLSYRGYSRKPLDQSKIATHYRIGQFYGNLYPVTEAIVDILTLDDRYLKTTTGFDDFSEKSSAYSSKDELDSDCVRFLRTSTPTTAAVETFKNTPENLDILGKVEMYFKIHRDELPSNVALIPIEYKDGLSPSPTTAMCPIRGTGRANPDYSENVRKMLRFAAEVCHGAATPLKRCSKEEVDVFKALQQKGLSYLETIPLDAIEDYSPLVFSPA